MRVNSVSLRISNRNNAGPIMDGPRGNRERVNCWPRVRRASGDTLGTAAQYKSMRHTTSRVSARGCRRRPTTALCIF